MGEGFILWLWQGVAFVVLEPIEQLNDYVFFGLLLISLVATIWGMFSRKRYFWLVFFAIWMSCVSLVGAVYAWFEPPGDIAHTAVYLGVFLVSLMSAIRQLSWNPVTHWLRSMIKRNNGYRAHILIGFFLVFIGNTR